MSTGWPFKTSVCSIRILTSAACVPTSLMEALPAIGRPPSTRADGSQERLLEDAWITSVLPGYLDLCKNCSIWRLECANMNILRFLPTFLQCFSSFLTTQGHWWVVYLISLVFCFQLTINTHVEEFCFSILLFPSLPSRQFLDQSTVSGQDWRNAQRVFCKTGWKKHTGVSNAKAWQEKQTPGQKPPHWIHGIWGEWNYCPSVQRLLWICLALFLTNFIFLSFLPRWPKK